VLRDANGDFSAGTVNATLGCGITANDKTSYGNVKLTKTKGGYYGINLGETTSNMTVMSSG